MDHQKMLRLEGAVENIVYRNEENGYTVLEIENEDENITAVGVMPLVTAGDSVILTGTFTEHKSYGRQFAAQTCEVVRPTKSADILRYLSSGAVKGIGAATARRLVDAFGDSTLDVLENDPERVAALKGISRDKANDFSNQLQANQSVRALMIYLTNYKIPNVTAIKIYKALGPSALTRIRDNPYLLCEGDFGVTFRTADVVAHAENHDAESSVRLRAGLLYILRHNEGNGHTCLPRDQLCRLAVDFLHVMPEALEDSVDEMIFDRTLMTETFETREFLFTQEMHRTELSIASRIKLMTSFPAEQLTGADKAIALCERSDGIEYADLQKEAITAAMTQGMLVLTGRPGTGKTTTLNAIIRILQDKGQRVLLAAPTGRAAQRMTELTGKEAKTLHRLLEVAWDRQDKPVFSKNEHNLLKCDALIIDEVSMVDVGIFDSVLRALRLGCRLVLVGDSDQLPSVGPGNVLGDLIASGAVPVVRLDKIFRQAQQSLIITNAHRIVSGEMPVLNRVDRDFFFIERNNKTDISSLICELCATRLPKAYGYSPFEDIQVLAPSKKGELGTVELNQRLQNVLNPKEEKKSEATIAGKTFRTGDKVMMTKNNYDIRWEREDGELGEGVFNGDIGTVKAIDAHAKKLWVDFPDKTAALDFEDAAELDFAYAVTVHKSQGNEFDCVIIPMFPGPAPLYYRNLLYTAVTRAKKTLILVGQPHTVEVMVNNNRQTKRYSGLKAFLERDDSIYQT